MKIEKIENGNLETSIREGFGDRKNLGGVRV